MQTMFRILAKGKRREMRAKKSERNKGWRVRIIRRGCSRNKKMLQQCVVDDSFCFVFCCFGFFFFAVSLLTIDL